MHYTRLVFPFPDMFFIPGNTGMAVLIPRKPWHPGMTYYEGLMKEIY